MIKKDLTIIILSLISSFITCNQNLYKIEFTYSGLNDNPQLNTINTPSNIDIYKSFNFYYNHEPITKMYIGTPPQCILTKISFDDYKTIVKDYDKNNINNLTQFKHNESSSFKLLNSSISKEYSSDIIQISNNKKNTFNFYLSKNINDTNKIGLGKKLDNSLNNDSYDVSLLNQLFTNNIIKTTVISIKYFNNTNGEINLGSNYSYINTTQYLELKMDESSLIISESIHLYLVESSTYVIMGESGLKLKINLNSSFISMPEEYFEKLLNSSFRPYINLKICEINEQYEIKYLVCSEDILNNKMDQISLYCQTEKQIIINLSKSFLPFQSKPHERKLLLGIVSSKEKKYINMGSVYLNNYVTFLNRDKNVIRFYMKEMVRENEPKDVFGIAGIITLGIIITILIMYMVSTICGKDKYVSYYYAQHNKNI